MRYYFTFIIIFFWSITLHAQNNYVTQSYIPPTPLASAIKLYGDIPVSYSTGVPDISIPIYTIEQDGFQLPIVLRYHVKSLKPASCRSNVALGWTLDCGGMISMSVYGKEGSANLHPYSAPIGSGTASDQEIFDIMKPNGYDSETDIYSYSAPGLSGEFIYTPNPPNGFITMGKRPVKISNLVNGSSQWIGYSIKNDQGTEFKFGNNNVHYTRTPTTVTSNGWLLYEVALTSGRSISYTYEDIPRFSVLSVKRSLSIAGDYQERQEYGTLPIGIDEAGFPPDQATITYPSSGQTYQYDEKNIKEINFANGKVEFMLSPDKRLITGVKIYNSGRMIREFQFLLSSNVAMGDMKLLEKVLVKDEASNTSNEYAMQYTGSGTISANVGTDYWGYYNGSSSQAFPCATYTYWNYSLFPTQLTLNTGGLCQSSKDANVDFAKMFSISRIQYPTGGSTSFVFGLNQLSSTVQGDGLRIEQIISNDGAGNEIKRSYSYTIPSNISIPQGKKEFGFTTYSVGGAYNSTIGTHWLYRIRNRTFDADMVSRMANLLLASRYDIITEVIGDGTNNIGKNIYYFKHNRNDVQAISMGYDPDDGPLFGILRYKNWDNDLLEKKEVFRNGELTPFSTTIYNYTYQYDTPIKNSFVTRLTQYPLSAAWNSNEPGTRQMLIGNGFSTSLLPHIAAYCNYEIVTGRVELTSELQIESTSTGVLTTTRQYQYSGAEKYYPSRITTTESDGTVKSVSKKYPYDQATTQPYQDMVAKNMLSPVIEEVQRKGMPPSETLLSTTRNNFYNWSGIYKPKIIEGALYSNALENRIEFDKYDAYGNVRELHKTNDVHIAYIWGYNNTYPVAEVTNASYDDVAYTGFENDFDKWNISSGGVVTDQIVVPTGKKALSITGTISAVLNLAPARTYVFSCWEQGTPLAGLGGSGLQVVSDRILKTTGSWRLREITFKNVTGNLNVLRGSGGSCFLDDVAVYPANAQMTSYTYDPLVGMTTKTDAAGRISYYVYDRMGRLQLVKDQDGNVLKVICYNYAGQPEDCGPAVYGNARRSEFFNRNDCGAGYTGSSVEYVVEAGTYTASSQEVANQMAVNDIAANGQQYANDWGSCTVSELNISYSNYSWGITDPITFIFTNTSTSQQYYLSTVAYSSSGVLQGGAIPPGMYNVEIWNNNPGSFSYTVSCSYFTSGSWSPLYIPNVEIGEACPNVVIDNW